MKDELSNPFPSQSDNVESVSVIVCTRNRGESVVGTIRTVLENKYPRFEIVVVDQSTNEETAEAVSPFLRDPRFRYHRTDTVGVGTARNIGIDFATSSLLAFTDDDCEVPVDWIEQIYSAFQEYPDIQLLYCDVEPGQHDTNAGFIPCYHSHGERRLETVADLRQARGIGAGFAARREMMLELGGFDRELGPGGRFLSCEDRDITIRALLKGYAVLETDRTYVLHHGYRTWMEGRALTTRDWVGIGAAFAKPLRGGYPSFVGAVLYEFTNFALLPPLRELLQGKKPGGWLRITGFIKGFSQGLFCDVNPETLCYIPSVGAIATTPGILPDSKRKAA